MNREERKKVGIAGKYKATDRQIKTEIKAERVKDRHR